MVKPSWRELRIGDVVWLRPKRAPGERVRETVVELLDRDLHGFGFIGSWREVRRSFYWDIIAPRKEPIQRPRRPPHVEPKVVEVLPNLVLTPMQLSVAQKLAAGLSFEQAASELEIAPATLQVHLRLLRRRYLAAGRAVPTLTALTAELTRETPPVAFRSRLVSPARDGSDRAT